MSSPSANDLHSAVTRARRLQEQAVAANLTGRAAAGARLATRGLAALGVSPLSPLPASWSDAEPAYVAARLTATLAKSIVEIDGLEPALALMDQAAQVAREIDDRDLQAFLAGQRGLILFRGGQLVEARRLLDVAAAATPDEAGIDKWRILVNRGALFVEGGEVGLARRDLERAVGLARANRLGQSERIALHNLGCLEFLAGDLPRALRLMQDGMEMDGEVQQGIAHLDRSRVLLAAGLPDDADTALAQAAELFRRDRCWQDLGEVDLTRAEVALLTDRVPDARHLAARARDRFRRHGNDRWRRAAELVLLYADRAAGRPPARLLPPVRRLVNEFADAGLATQSRMASLLAAELEQALGRTGEATARLARVGPVKVTDPIALRLQGRLVRAENLELRGKLAAARRTVARGLQDLATYQAQFGGLDLQSSSAVHGRRLAEHDLELALRTGRPGSVVAAVERSRAVTGRIQSVTPPADQQTAALLSDLRRAIDAEDRSRVAELQSELRSRAWLTSGSRACHPPVRLAELRTAAAAEGVHLVTITELRDRVGAVTMPVVGPLRQVELADVGAVREWQRRISADLDTLANAGLPPPMVTAVTRSLRHAADELGRLLAPAFPADDRAVVVSAAGVLLALPWQLLPPLAGRPVSVAPSLSNWQRAWTGLVTHGPSATDWSLTAAAGPDLAHARGEIHRIVATWRSHAEAIELPSATPAALLAATATSRVVHVAAHGVHRGENPMFSSLSLTGGPLFAYEFDQRERLPEHVVLSACDVGRSTVRSGRETLGLTSVLLQLGCPSVVAGVTRVSDDVAAEIMQRYHAELARGRTAAEALCLVAEQVPAPSPFVCFGASWSA